MNLKRLGVGGCELTEKILDLHYDKLKKDEVLVIDEGWGYQGEHVSEKIAGEWIKSKDRNKLFIIEKLPLFFELYEKQFGKSVYNMNEVELNNAVRTLLTEQLSLLNVKYFDCYMLHALFDMQHSQGYDIEQDIELYKRLTPILLKLKEDGLIKSIGFSAHITYERLSYFLSEVDPKNEVFSVAEISYNILNSKGAPSWCSKQTGIIIWDAIGERGIKHLKDLGYIIIDCMPLESGRVCQVNTSESFLGWAREFVRDNKDIDVILAGTKSENHLEKWFRTMEGKHFVDIPNMREIPNMKHCGGGGF